MKFTKKDIKSLLSRIWEFRNNLVFLVMVFTPSLAVSFGATWGLCYLCTLFELPYTYTSPIIRALLSVSPAVPTLIIWSDRDHFGDESGITDGIMDACFAIWIIIAIYAWKAYH